MFSRLFLSASASRFARHYIRQECALNISTNFSQTSVFFQTGLKICELPMVVQKVHDVLRIGEEDQSKLEGKYLLAASTKINPEVAEILNGFNRCSTVRNILRLLETIPADEVSPVVAVHVLKKITFLHYSQNNGSKNFNDKAFEERRSM